MTRQREFKALVRERMTRTGERYAAARAQILSQREHHSKAGAAADYPGVLPGYRTFGGTQSSTAPLTNVLRALGVVWPATGRPYTEAIVNGLCGGPGFLYAVFEYQGWPPLLSIALQARSMPDAFVSQGIGRLNVTPTVHETSSAAAARKHLDGALAAGSPALVALGLRTAAAVGRHGDDYWFDGRSPVPTRLPAEAVAKKRAAYAQAKHRLTTLAPAATPADPIAVVRAAIADTAKSYLEPPVPKAFQVNCGLSGLAKWQRMLTDGKDKKGWPTLFGEGPRACAGLSRAYGWIACFIAPGAGRPLYADFLDEASHVTSMPSLADAANAFRESGREWSELATFIARVDDETVRRRCESAEAGLESLDVEGDCSASENPMDLIKEHQTANAGCRLTKEAARSIYSEMSDRIGRIAQLEWRAVEAMGASGSTRPSVRAASRRRGPSS